MTTIPDLLRASAARDPQRTALRHDGVAWTYAQLDEASDRVAGCLAAAGVRPGDRVALLSVKNREAVAAIYGILKAGAAYVPLDPFAPAARGAQIIQDCGIRHLVTTPPCLDAVARLRAAGTGALQVIGGDEASTSWEAIETSARALPTLPDRRNPLAYILYTSGSTGAPKGIMHTHRSALAFIEWAAETLSATADDRFSSHAPFIFDLSILDLFVSARAGASLLLIPEATARVPASLSELISQERITIWYSVPFALRQLDDRGCLASRDLRSLRWVLFAGEPMESACLQRLRAALPQARFANLYGPTETNVCTWYRVPAGPPVPLDVPIGLAASGDEVWIDHPDEADADGVSGELIVRGPSLMAGYWHAGRADEAAVGDMRAVATYATGDRVRRLADGNYVFLGRRDRQIKLRGYRIELDEIERVLMAHDDVEQAAVFVSGTGDAAAIQAAVVLRSGPSGVPDVRAHAARLLPSYALPASIAVHEALPRTATGKIDRRALAEAGQDEPRTGHPLGTPAAQTATR